MTMAAVKAQAISMTPAEVKGGMRLSMHHGIAVWCDCCSCEAEPYWVAVADELGIEFGEAASQRPKSAKYVARLPIG